MKNRIFWEESEKWVKVLLILIIIRIFCYSFFLYSSIPLLIKVSNYTGEYSVEIKSMTVMLNSLYVLLISLDILTAYLIKKERNSFRIIGLISSIISILLNIFFAVSLIHSTLMTYNLFSQDHFSLSKLMTYYVFNPDHLSMLIILAVSIYCVILLSKNKFSKIQNTIKFAEPISNQ